MMSLRRRIPGSRMIQAWTLALVLAAPAGLAGQDREGRTLDPRDEELLSRWATERLAHLPPPGTDRLPEGVDLEMERLRALYFLSVGDKGRTDEADGLARSLVRRLPETDPRSALALAYRGAVEVVRAKHAFWPPTKLDHLKEGVGILDRLVEADPDRLEIRYLRLVSCYYLPFFLKREESVASDMKVLALHLPDRAQEFSPVLYLGVSQFLLDNGELSPRERERLVAAQARVREEAEGIGRQRGWSSPEEPAATEHLGSYEKLPNP